MKKKLITLLLSATLAMSSLAGCGKAPASSESKSTAKESSVAESSQKSEVVEETGNFNEEGYPIVNEEITLKIMLGVADSFNCIPPEEMPAIKRLEELTGIKTEWEVIKAADWNTKLNLMLASEEYPDVIMSNFTTVNYEELGVAQKILIPLDDLIDKYLPSYKERIAMEENDPTAWLKASDGQTYTVSYMNNSQEYMVNQFHINKKWLDTLGLDMPKTIEDLTEVLRAFKTKDPNGNGEADEIPMIGGMNVVTYSIPFYLQLFGVPYNMENWLYIDDDKKVQLVPWQDGFRECMEWLHMCFEEGLLDVEVLSQDMATIGSKVSSGKVGFSSFYIPRSDIGPDAAADFTLYIPGEEAKLTWILSQARPGTYITKANEHPEATMRLFEAMLEKETMYSMYIGEKDGAGWDQAWDYNEKGLLYYYTVENKNKPANRPFLNVYGIFFAPGEYYSQNIQGSDNWLAKCEYDDAYKNTGLQLKYSHTYLKWVTFSGEQDQKRALIETEIKNAVDEHMAKFIKDGVTDSSWDEFVGVLKNVKAEEYVKMYQDGIDTLDLN